MHYLRARALWRRRRSIGLQEMRRGEVHTNKSMGGMQILCGTKVHRRDEDREAGEPLQIVQLWEVSRQFVQNSVQRLSNVEVFNPKKQQVGYELQGLHQWPIFNRQRANFTLHDGGEWRLRPS